MRYTTQNYFDEGGNRLVIGGEIVINGKLSIADDADVDELVTFTATATETVTGGIKAAAAGVGDTVEVKIGADGKAYVPAYPDYTLPAATDNTLGGVKMAANQEESTAGSVDDLLTDFNALLAKLKAAGIMVADETGT
jgi:hypothetical protein